MQRLAPGNRITLWDRIRWPPGFWRMWGHSAAFRYPTPRKKADRWQYGPALPLPGQSVHPGPPAKPRRQPEQYAIDDIGGQFRWRHFQGIFHAFHDLHQRFKEALADFGIIDTDGMR